MDMSSPLITAVKHLFRYQRSGTSIQLRYPVRYRAESAAFSSTTELTSTAVYALVTLRFSELLIEKLFTGSNYCHDLMLLMLNFSLTKFLWLIKISGIHIEAIFQAGVLKLENFTNEELIGIFDSIYSCLVCWLEGHSLDQILFTCLYLHNPHEISDKVLKSFCLAIRKLIPIIKDFVIEYVWVLEIMN